MVCLRLVCTTLTTMARIVLNHLDLRTRVETVMRKISRTPGHPFVLNRANESLKLIQERLGEPLLLNDEGSTTYLKQMARMT